VLCGDQNQAKLSSLERDIETREQERTRLLMEKGRLEQEAEVCYHCRCLEWDE